MSNQVFYNDMNVGRRDILETVNKQNVYYWQIYIKYLYERSQTEKHHKNFVYEESRYISKFLAYIYEYMNDIEITHITGDDLDEYAYFLSTQLGLSYHGICREMLSFVRCYKYLFGKGLVPESDVLNYKMKRKGREIATNLITDEQIQLASEKLPDNLKMYMMFSLSTGIRMEDLLVLKWNQLDIPFEKAMGCTVYALKYNCKIKIPLKHICGIDISGIEKSMPIYQKEADKCLGIALAWGLVYLLADKLEKELEK